MGEGVIPVCSRGDPNRSPRFPPGSEMLTTVLFSDFRGGGLEVPEVYPEGPHELDRVREGLHGRLEPV